MNTDNIRYDLMIGTAYPSRVAQRVTAAEALRIAAEMRRRIDFSSARMIGRTTAEVALLRL